MVKSTYINVELNLSYCLSHRSTFNTKFFLLCRGCFISFCEKIVCESEKSSKTGRREKGMKKEKREGGGWKVHTTELVEGHPNSE